MQLIIISDDLCGRNGLKSKVSTLEELYDFSLKYSKITSQDVILSCRQNVDRLVFSRLHLEQTPL